MYATLQTTPAPKSIGAATAAQTTPVPTTVHVATDIDKINLSYEFGILSGFDVLSKIFAMTVIGDR